MALSDILNLNQSLAPRLIRILYGLALILIALGVVLGLAQAVRTATRIPPPTPLQISGQPNSSTPQTGQLPSADHAPALLEGRVSRRGFGPRRFGANGFRQGSGGPFGMNARRNPALAGAFLIVRTLVMGFTGLLVVRILAEMALSILTLSQRTQIGDNATEQLRP